MRLAFLTGYQHIADITKQEMNSIEVDWDVSVLLPPSDVDLGAEKFVENIKKLAGTRLVFMMPVFCKTLKINSVRVLPEGFCAFIGETFENSRQIRKGYEKVIKGSTLVVDIGAGTMDLCIVDNSKLVDTSRYSEETGGNQVFQKLNTTLRKEYGKNFPEDSLRESAVTGVIKVGAREINIEDELEAAKKDVSTKLSNTIRNYIEGSDYSVSNIEYILLCGGGADKNGSSLKPLGDYLKDDLSVWMNYSDFLEIPEQEVVLEKDGDETITKERISPRLLNIIGAGVLSEN